MRFSPNPLTFSVKSSHVRKGRWEMIRSAMAGPTPGREATRESTGAALTWTGCRAFFVGAEKATGAISKKVAIFKVYSFRFLGVAGFPTEWHLPGVLPVRCVVDKGGGPKPPGRWSVRQRRAGFMG